MKILYIHQYFNTPKEPGGTRSYWISKKLIEHGHNVIMLTSKNNLKKKKEELDIDGIKVIYLNIPYNQRMNFFKRLIAFSKFMIRSCFMVIKLRNEYDIIYATSTPLSVGVPALIANKILNKPYFFEVRDLWPEVPIQMGQIKNSLMINLLRGLEKLIYHNAKKIIALSPGMRTGVLNTGIEKNRVVMVPNMSKPNEFYPRSVNHILNKQFGISSDFINIIYFGAIGKANGLYQFVQSFSKTNNKAFKLYIAGDGSEKQKIEEEIKKKSLNNVHLIGKHPMKVISDIVNSCDISLVCFDSSIPILSTNSPNKLFDSLSAGKPIIVNSDGWTKEIIEQYDCGFYYNPFDKDNLAEILLEIENKKQKLIEMGKNSRELSISKFDRDILTKEIVKLF